MMERAASRSGTSDAEARSRRENEGDNDPPRAGAAPGARISPQHPGEVPDRSTIPGQHTTRVPRATRVQRPLTEEGTAQEIMGVFRAKPGEEMNPARFEQATASYEELRKAFPAQLPPTHPAPGYALATGDAMASEMQAIGGPGATPSAPGATTGEAYQARPGEGTANVAAPAKSEAPAAEVGSAFSPNDMPASVRSPSDATAPPSASDLPAGQSTWAAASPAPGEAQGLGGTLPAAKDVEINRGAGSGAAPPRSGTL